MDFKQRILVRADLNRKIIYTAIVPSEADKAKIRTEFPPQHKIAQDLHITLALYPGKLPDNLGKEVTFRVYGYANDEKADALSVILDNVECQNEIPHITLSVSEGTKPKYSNELLAKGYEAIEPIQMKGKIGAFVGTGYIFNVPEPKIENPKLPYTFPPHVLMDARTDKAHIDTGIRRPVKINRINQDTKKPL